MSRCFMFTPLRWEKAKNKDEKTNPWIPACAGMTVKNVAPAEIRMSAAPNETRRPNASGHAHPYNGPKSGGGMRRFEAAS